MVVKSILFFIAFFMSAACSAVDVNQASEAELDGIKGIGPPTSRLIIAEREKSEFKDWDDFMSRVKGAGPKNAARFSADGLTVTGLPYLGQAPSGLKTAKKGREAAADSPAARPAQ
ncbi:MAG: helix-hairpin-helix domain-containing protein [Polaromonas sp.]|nr:helix-hairpin-helix domain-containing protein [Polaromonas sp.]